MTRAGLVALYALTLTACGARSGLREPAEIARTDASTPTDLGAPTGCVADTDCAPTGDPCVAATCIAGRCARRPVPFGTSPQNFTVPGGLGHAARDGDGAVVTTVLGTGRPSDRIGLQRVTLQGLLGTPIPLVSPMGPRVWDHDIAATRDGLVLAAHGGSQTLLWQVDLRGAVSEPRPLDGAGNFVTLSESTDGLVLTAERASPCAMAWVTADGRWRRNGWDQDPGACPAAQVGPVGTPAWRRSVGRTAEGAWFVALTADGRLHRTEAAPGRVRTAVERFALADSDGAQYVRSLVAVEAGDRVAALWVRTANDAQPETMQVREAVLDRQLRPIAAELNHDTMGLVYSPNMDIAYCHERFVSLWFDANTGTVTQNGLDGVALAGPIKFGRGLSAIPVRLVCVPGGAVVAYQGAVSVFRCGG